MSGTMNPPSTFKVNANGIQSSIWLFRFQYADGEPRIMDGWNVELDIAPIPGMGVTAVSYSLQAWVSDSRNGEVSVALPMHIAKKIQGAFFSGEIRATTVTGAKIVLGMIEINTSEQP